MMERAEWKLDLFHGADASLVAEEIASIGAEATPEQIVEKAKDSKTELHKCFDWNNDVAAQKWRIYQARQVVCNLVYVPVEKPEAHPIRIFYKAEANAGYQQTKQIIRSHDKYQELLARARMELHAFKVKYNCLTELEEIMALID